MAMDEHPSDIPHVGTLRIHRRDLLSCMWEEWGGIRGARWRNWGSNNYDQSMWLLGVFKGAVFTYKTLQITSKMSCV